METLISLLKDFCGTSFAVQSLGTVIKDEGEKVYYRTPGATWESVCLERKNDQITTLIFSTKMPLPFFSVKAQLIDCFHALYHSYDGKDSVVFLISDNVTLRCLLIGHHEGIALDRLYVDKFYIEVNE